MGSMPDPLFGVTAGVDTHRDTHVGAVLDHLGRLLATASFPASAAGYQSLLAWLEGFGPVVGVGVEGTGAWGAGLTRFPVESLRLLKVAGRSVMKQRTMVANQIHSVIATVPEQLRAHLRGLSIARIVDLAAGYRPGDASVPLEAAKITLKALTRRHRYLTNEICELDTNIEQLVGQTAPPGLLALCGVGPQTAADLLITAGSNPHPLKSGASSAALCGTWPLDASSGRQQHHRLNRDGDRQANAALYRIVIVRLRYHQQPTHQAA